MPVFTFYLHETQDAIPPFEIVHFDDIDPALEHGRRLLKERPRYTFIDITNGDASVARVTREAL